MDVASPVVLSASKTTPIETTEALSSAPAATQDSTLSSKPAVDASTTSTSTTPVISPPFSNTAAPAPEAAQPKAAPKKFRVRTNGASLWQKAIENAHAPPFAYVKLAIPFNVTIPEVFERICHFLDGLSLFGLYMTGDSKMRARIVTTVDDLRFTRNHGLYPFTVRTNKWPQFASLFPKLRNFEIKYWPIEKFASSIQKATTNLLSLPLTLNSLYLDCEFPKSQYSHLKRFPNLESLTLARTLNQRDIVTTTPIPAEDLPPHLTYLRAEVNLKLPESIPRQLELASQEQRALVPALQSLQFLHLRYETTLDISLFALLNPDIRELHLPGHNAFRAEWLIDLPKHLSALTLNFSCSPPFQYEDFFSALPKDLAELAVLGEGLRIEGLKLLPKSLTKLRFQARDDSKLDLLGDKWPLPFLKHLRIDARAGELCLSGLPKDLESLHMAGFTGDLQHLPPNLKDLRLPGVNISDGFMAVVPKHLTVLKLESCTSISPWAKFPNTLTVLTIGSILQNNHVPDLPRALTKLTLTATTALTAYCAKDLPRSLRIISLFRNSPFDFSCVPNLPPQLEVFIVQSSQWSHQSMLPNLKLLYHQDQQKQRAHRHKKLMEITKDTVVIW